MARDDNMAIKPLVDYIEKNLKKGYNLESLKWALITQKHSRIEIEKAIKIVQARTPSVKKEEPKMEVMPEIRKEEIVIPKKSFWQRIFGRG